VCGKEDSHGFGRALRRHTTRRNADDRTAPARSVRHAVPRNTSQESTASADTVDVVPASSLVPIIRYRHD